MTIEPFEVEDSVTEEGKFEWVVKRLRNNCSGGPSQKQAERIRGFQSAGKITQSAYKRRITGKGDCTGNNSRIGWSAKSAVSIWRSDQCRVI